MHNDFIILGPAADPARSRVQSSRGHEAHRPGRPVCLASDNSGTHTKEKGLWKAAGIDPEGQNGISRPAWGWDRPERAAEKKAIS